MPSSVVDIGANEQIDAFGRLPHVKLTLCVEPFSGVTVNVTLPDWPATIVNAFGIAETLKSAPALTTCVTTGDVLAA